MPVRAENQRCSHGLKVNCKGFTSWSHMKVLKNDICITEIGQAVLEIFEFKVEFLRKIPKIRNFAIVSIIRVEQ